MPPETSSPAPSRASVSTKIFLIVAIFSLPIGVLAYLLASNYTPQIATAQLELSGNSLQKPLMKALAGTFAAQTLTDACKAGNCADELGKQSSAIQTSLAAASAVNAQVSADLKTTNEELAKKNHSDLSLQNLQNEATAISSFNKLLANPEDREKLSGQIDQLGNQIKQLVSYQGDTSNLILDPDLDSYYLVDVTLLAMPEAMTHIRNASLIANKLVSGTGGAVEQAALANERTLLEESLSRIEASNNTTFDADAANHGVSPTLQPKLRDGLKAYNSVVASYMQTLKAIAANPAQVQSEALASQAVAAQNASLAYWEAGANELDTLLNMRISDFETGRMQALGFSALAVLIATLIAFLIGRSITKPLQELVRNLGPGATLLGASVERIAQASQSQTPNPMESAIICEELNAHADNMRQAVLELARHVEGSAAASRQISAPSGAEAKQ